MAYSDTVLAKSPLLYWRLGENPPGTGTAVDASPNGRNGTYVGSPASIAGLIQDTNTAVDFSGTGQWVTSTYNPFATGATRTFEFWVKRDATTDADCIFGGDQPSTQPLLVCNLTANTVSFFTDAGAAGQTWAGNVIEIGQVYHVVLTFTGSTKVSELYINSVSQGTKTHSTDFNAAPGNFTLCKRSTGSDPFDGKIDEAAIYGSILTAMDVRENYWAGFGASLLNPPNLPF
jgi:hypothetical protein